MEKMPIQEVLFEDAPQEKPLPKVAPEEQTAAEILAKQIVEAKAAGKEYQGKEALRTVKSLAVEK